MRPETQRLWEQAQEDVVTARRLLEVERYYASVFFAQQAAEKAPQACYQARFQRAIFTHDVVELAEALSAPAEVLDAARELTSDYVTTRYPNAANAVPARLYTEASARMHLEMAERVLAWARPHLT
ncbi:MAG: HEPN domain-containing protein [Dehalococcoidia bacterium]|nr:HEPN domain-containing protein [Dehalococcoidia bacterium]MDW8120467.1 HEPN domain-containing protein [Chloroflexota bacterium]